MSKEQQQQQDNGHMGLLSIMGIDTTGIDDGSAPPPPTTPPAAAAPAAPSTPPATPPAGGNEPPPPVDGQNDNPFLKHFFGGQPEGQTELTLAPEVAESLKKVTGWEDPAKGLKEALALSERHSALESEFQKVKAFKENVEKLPVQLQNLITAAVSNEDWASMAATIKPVDYSLPGEKQPDDYILSTFRSGKLTPEQIEQVKKGEATDALKEYYDLQVKMGREAYESERTVQNNYLAEKQRSYNEFVAAREHSADVSLAEFRRNHPELATFITPDVRKSLIDGSGPMSHFYDEKGVIKPAATYNHVILSNLPKVLDAIRYAASKEGRERGVLETMGRQHAGAPAHGQRTPPAPSKEVDPGYQGLAQILGMTP